MWSQRWEQVLLVSFLHCSHRSCVCEIFLKAQNASEKHERNFNKIKSMISVNFFSQLSSRILILGVVHISTKISLSSIDQLIDASIKKKLKSWVFSIKSYLYIHDTTTDIIAFLTVTYFEKFIISFLSRNISHA